MIFFILIEYFFVTLQLNPEYYHKRNSNRYKLMNNCGNAAD